MQDYQTCSLNIEDLWGNTNYDKVLWFNPTNCWIEDTFADEIEENVGYQDDGKEYFYQHPEFQHRVQINYPADSIEDVAKFFHEWNKDFSYIKVDMEAKLTFSTEDGEDSFEVKVSKMVKICKDDEVEIADDTDYMDDSWNTIQVEDSSSLVSISDEYISKFNELLSSAPKIGEADQENIKVVATCHLNDSDQYFLITEAEKKCLYIVTKKIYSVFLVLTNKQACGKKKLFKPIKKSKKLKIYILT